jgi:hypothetical protein
VADFSGGHPPASVDYWENWGDPAVLNGWDPASNLQLAGDFMGLGHAQVLFLNRSGTGGRVMIADFSSGHPPVTVRCLENWGDSPVLNGWDPANNLQLAGDFVASDMPRCFF